MSDAIEVSMEYPMGTDNAALVTRVGEGLYRFELDPLAFMFAETEQDLETFPRYGDVVEAEDVGSGTLRFVRVVQRARFRSFDFLLPVHVATSEEMDQVLLEVESHKGHWERVFGGLLLVFLPEGAEYDPTEEIQRLCRPAPQ